METKNNIDKDKIKEEVLETIEMLKGMNMYK